MSMTITRGSKALKFKAFKAGWILAGMKTATLRLFDDKDLQVADKLDLINSDTGVCFAQAVVTEIVQKNLGAVKDSDLTGHEKWNDSVEMLQSLRVYYGDKVNPKTPAKIVRFKLL